MKQGKKRLLVTLLAALMLLGVSPLGIAAETESITESVVENVAEGQTLSETPDAPEATEPEEAPTETETPEAEAPAEPEMETPIEAPAASDETADSDEAEPAELEAEAEVEAAAVSLTAADSALSLDAAAVYGRVHVIVENTTYTTAAGAPWDGVLVDTWVNLSATSTATDCIVAALTKMGYTQKGAEFNYITEVNGLAAYDGGSMSGWMGTFNGWFADVGFGSIAVNAEEPYKLAANDEIRLMYTLDWGVDIGGDWSSTDKTLTALTVDVGTLSPAFASRRRPMTASGTSTACRASPNNPV